MGHSENLPRHAADVSERVISYALKTAREHSAWCRLNGCRTDDFTAGSLYGQVLVAKYDLGADPVAVQAAHNEIRFLMNRYGRN